MALDLIWFEPSFPDYLIRAVGAMCMRLSDSTFYNVDNTNPTLPNSLAETSCAAGQQVYSIELRSGAWTDQIAMVCADRTP